MTASLPPLSDVIRTVWSKKSLGQHFLVNEEICRRIAMCAGSIAGKTIIEIGPGPGGLTRALLEQGAHVHAIEKDPRCAAALAPLQEVYSERFFLEFQDALRMDFSCLSNPSVISNLPYNISTQLLFRWLPSLEKFDQLVLMFQKEVAERLYAQPRTKAYGRLSVLLQTKAHITKMFHLPPGAFLPPPKVHSTVVSIVPKRENIPPTVYDALCNLTRNAFAKRRKMIRNTQSLSEQMLTQNGISPHARAEDLTTEQFLKLAVCCI